MHYTEESFPPSALQRGQSRGVAHCGAELRQLSRGGGGAHRRLEESSVCRLLPRRGVHRQGTGE